MLTLISIELYKIFRKWRSYIGFIAITSLILLVETAMYFEGSGFLNAQLRGLDSFVFTGNLLNGYLIAYFVMGALVIHIPFLITLVAGDLLAGEATAGTYRMLITRPLSRFKLVTAKFLSGLIYTFLLIVWLAGLSLGIGLFIFGSGELIVVQKSIIIFAKDDIIWRFILAYGFATLSMSVVAALAFLFSSLVENAIGPIITTMAIVIVFIILSAINIDFFRNLRPYLFTTYMMDWRLFFDNPLDKEEIVKAVLFLFAHVAGLYFLTLFLFKRKDILS